MKKILVFFLFAILALPFVEFVGLRLEIKQLKKSIKKELLARIDPSHTITLRFHKTDLSNRKDIIFHIKDSEIEIGGEMYDIISDISYSDSLIYICYRDHKESELKRKMYASLANFFSQNPIQSESSKSLFLFLKNLIFEELESFHFFNFELVKTISQINIIASIHNGHLLLESPPPEF